MYVLIITYFTAAGMAYDFYITIKWGLSSGFIAQSDKELTPKIIIIFSYILDFIICCLMTSFLKFHLMLATENKTTIENLDKQGRPYDSIYDVGASINWR